MKNMGAMGGRAAAGRRARRRGTARLFVLSAAFVAAASGAPAGASAAALTGPGWARLSSRTPGITSSPRLQPRAQQGAGQQGPIQQRPIQQRPIQQGPAQQAQDFAIPAGTLEDALRAFGAATGITVGFANPDLGMLPSPGVSGRFTPRQALDRLLMGTSVTVQFTSPTTGTADLGASEFVSVEGRVPQASASPKFNQPLRDVPQTIAVIPSSVIQSQGAASLRDVLRNVPGITFQAGEGGGGLPGDSFTLRGFSAGNDMFVDGVRDVGGYSRDAFNLEQVEVAKGPSAAIAGRGATGGAINQVTKNPLAADLYAGSLALGNASYQRGTFDINRQVGGADSTTAVRLNAMWFDTGVPGRDVVENSSWGVAPSVGFGLGGPTQVTLKYQHLSQDNVPDYGLPWGSYPGFPTGAFQATPAVDQSNFYGLRNYDFEDIRSDIATVEVAHRLNNRFTLRNISRYNDNDRNSAITAPRPPNRQLQRRTMSNDNLANQLSVTGTVAAPGQQHDLVFGVDVSRERTANQNSAQNINQPQTDLVRPNPSDLPLGPMPANSGNPSETRLGQVGAYAFDTVRLGSHWEVTGGARVDVVDAAYALTTLATGEVTRADRSDTMVSWRGGVVYKPREAGSIYVGYGTSFNPSVDAGNTGAGFGTTATSANSPNLEPEQSRNVELGAKWELGQGRLALNGAVFRTEKTNARTRNLNSEPFILGGRQRVQGIELGISGTIAPRWTAYAGYAFMDSSIARSANGDEEGNNLTLTPENTFNVWSTYELPMGLTVGGGAQYMDAVFRNTTNTTRVPSYWLLSSLVSYRVNERLTMRLNGQNLTDERFVDRVGGGHYIPGPRRQVLLSMDVGF
ncbi:MAG: TonB-dependent siderophore receptor [Vicinamibacterales bacterium]